MDKNEETEVTVDSWKKPTRIPLRVKFSSSSIINFPIVVFIDGRSTNTRSFKEMTRDGFSIQLLKCESKAAKLMKSCRITTLLVACKLIRRRLSWFTFGFGFSRLITAIFLSLAFYCESYWSVLKHFSSGKLQLQGKSDFSYFISNGKSEKRNHKCAHNR